MAEAKVEIFQNARTTFEAMAQEIADATEICIYNLTTENIDSNSFYRPSLTIKTIAHWIENNEQKSGDAVVQYFIDIKNDLKNNLIVNDEKIFPLYKKIFPYNTTVNGKKYARKKTDDDKYTAILSEYLVGPIGSNNSFGTQPNKNFPIYIERITSNNDNTSWHWVGDDYQTRLVPVSSGEEEGFSNDNSDTKDYANNSLPVAIRITMTFTDEFVRAKRTVSRVFWIPKGK